MAFAHNRASSSDPGRALADLLVQGRMLAPSEVAQWLEAVRAAGLGPDDPLCLTLIPSPKRAIRWEWRPGELDRFLAWFGEAAAAYGLTDVGSEFEGRILHLSLGGQQVDVDWLYVNRERWFGGAAIILNRALAPWDMAVQALDTEWVDVVVVLGQRNSVDALMDWFGVDE